MAEIEQRNPVKQPILLTFIRQMLHGRFAVTIDYQEDILRIIVEQAAQTQEPSLPCWFCKRLEAVEGEQLEHQMYRAPTGAVFLGGTIYYESLILEVPRCPTCAQRHKWRNRRSKGAMIASVVTFGLALPFWPLYAFLGDFINYKAGTNWPWALVTCPGYQQVRKEKFVTGPSPRMKIFTTFTWYEV